jgi:hypothetical protein
MTDMTTSLPGLFDRYADKLRLYGKVGVTLDDFVMGRESKLVLRYAPFEYVNREAKLVIVGITPGPNQIELAYEKTREMLLAGQPKANILREVKKSGAFGGEQVRPNLERILTHFKFDHILGIDHVRTLWEHNAHLMHSTSVVPHATFVLKKDSETLMLKETPFAGTFDKILNSKLLHRCFMERFVPTLAQINREARFIGLGRCPESALAWCVKEGYLFPEQVLGSFCHPSRNGGSTVAYYLREKTRTELKPDDPVLKPCRCDWLDDAYENMYRVTEKLIAQVT